MSTRIEKLEHAKRVFNETMDRAIAGESGGGGSSSATDALVKRVVATATDRVRQLRDDASRNEFSRGNELESDSTLRDVRLALIKASFRNPIELRDFMDSRGGRG